MKKTAINIIGAFTALVIVLSLVFGCGVFLFACSGKNDKKIYDVVVNNLDIYYLTTSTIDFDSVTLTVIFDDDDMSTDVFKNKEYDIRDRKAADDTEFILNTDGLYDQVKAGGDLTPGNYHVSVSVPSYKYEKDFGTVTVGDDYASDLIVFSYEAPELMVSFNSRLKEASSAEDAEDKFYQSPESYYVGDDNEFVFKPVLNVMNMAGSWGTFSGYDKDFGVTLVKEDEGTYLDDSEYFSVSEDDFSVQFTPAAVGETFTVEVSAPEGFTQDYNDNVLDSFSMDVTVADGWNVYSAMDLGMMNVTSNTINRQEYVITDALGNRSDFNQQLSGEYFWDEDKGEMTDKDTVKVWTEFLEDNGYDAPSPVNGIFLHSDISVTTRDFPEDFIITESEAKHFGCDYDEMIGSVRDGVKLYEKYMEDDDFTFNGNLFTVDVTSLKWAMTYIDSDGKELDHYPENKTSTYRGGRLSLFAVQGKVSESLGSDSRPTATFENLGGVGNAIDANDVEGKEGGSYAFIESLSSQTVVDNCHARNFLYGLRAEDSGENYVNLTVKNTKVYDCYFAGMRLSRAASNEVYNSYFKRFSGPAIFLMSELEADAPKYGGYYQSGVVNDEDTVLENYIDGSEAWFISSGATSIASYISMADGLIQACSAVKVEDESSKEGYKMVPTKTITNEDGKMNMTIFEQGTDDFGNGGAKMNTYYQNGNAIPFILNESTIDGTKNTQEDFGDDVGLYNAACLNYFVDGVKSGSFTPIPAVFGSNTGKLVAIDNAYAGFYSPIDLRNNNGSAYLLDEDGKVVCDENGDPTVILDSMSLGDEDTQLCVYYRMDSVGDGAGLCLVVDLLPYNK